MDFFMTNTKSKHYKRRRAELESMSRKNLVNLVLALESALFNKVKRLAKLTSKLSNLINKNI